MKGAIIHVIDIEFSLCQCGNFGDSNVLTQFLYFLIQCSCPLREHHSGWIQLMWGGQHYSWASVEFMLCGGLCYSKDCCTTNLQRHAEARILRSDMEGGLRDRVILNNRTKISQLVRVAKGD